MLMMKLNSVLGDREFINPAQNFIFTLINIKEPIINNQSMLIIIKESRLQTINEIEAVQILITPFQLPRR